MNKATVTIVEKPTVHYRNRIGTPVVGYRVLLETIDHPRQKEFDYEEYGLIQTSTVVEVAANGIFYTKNTKYVPEGS